MRYKWVCQDSDGFIKGFPNNKPLKSEMFPGNWISTNADWECIQEGTGVEIEPLKINLETHDYKIEDGILMKVEKGDTDVQNNAPRLVLPAPGYPIMVIIGAFGCGFVACER